VKEVRLAKDAGHSIEWLKDFVEGGGELSELIAVNRHAASGLEGIDPIPEFSRSTFLQYLISFIVSDDQVSSLLIHISCLIFLNRPHIWWRKMSLENFFAYSGQNCEIKIYLTARCCERRLSRPGKILSSN